MIERREDVARALRLELCGEFYAQRFSVAPLAAELHERALVVQQIAQELAAKGYPCPDERHDLAQDYFAEVATSAEASIDARVSAAKYLGADAAWGQSQQMLTRWLFNRAALEVIAGYRKTFEPDPAS